VEFAAGLPEGPGSQQTHFLQALKDFLFEVYTNAQAYTAH